jgi:hypothetical protein
MEGMSDLAEKARCQVVHDHANVSIQGLSYLNQLCGDSFLLICR